MTIARLRPLVSTNWLSNRLASLTDPRKLRVLDTTFSTDPDYDTYMHEYKPKHIPGSKFFDLYECVEPTPHIPRNLPNMTCFTEYVRSLGVWSDTQVVTYDRVDSKAACRVWWLLRLFGHESVSVLDGGLGKWVSDGHDTSADDPDFEMSDFTPKMNSKLLRDFDSMMTNIETRKAQVMDARGEKSFYGQLEDPRSGHIPGAINLPFTWLFNRDGTFRSEKELATLYESAGIDLSEPVIASCQTGMTACALAFTSHLLGNPEVPVYYGSWQEWGQRAKEEHCIKGDK